jgi:hypothetical protein
MFKIEFSASALGPKQEHTVSQLIVRLPDGTPIAFAAEFGLEDAVAVGHCKDPDFNTQLRRLGLNETTTVRPWKGN